jgi:hypothetical protein
MLLELPPNQNGYFTVGVVFVVVLAFLSRVSGRGAASCSVVVVAATRPDSEDVAIVEARGGGGGGGKSYRGF